MSVIIKRAGVLDAFQDVGRFGYGGWGINPCGAMDQFALMTANALVGNSLTEAAIEMHYPAPSLYFSTPALISLTGGDFTPRINDVPISNWKTILVPKDATLTFNNKISGFRSYLSVHGGFALGEWLGSKSTNLKVSVGGFEGRALRKNDEFSLNASVNAPALQTFPWTISHQEIYQQSSIINFLPSRVWESLTNDIQTELLSTQIKILPASDRMGYYFDNEPIFPPVKEELLSSAVDFGTLQILPTGKLLCLMADHQTTGGYPTLGSVISSHLPKLSQMSPGSAFTLAPISLEEAEKRLFSQHQKIRLVASTIQQKLKSILQ
jgi:antagonist of KipI